MALDRICPHCDGAKEKFGETCWWCDGKGRVVQPDVVLTVPQRNTPPQVTHHCPNCEAAARERDEAYEDSRQMQQRLQRLIDANPDVADLHALCDRQADILSRVAVALRGPEPPLTKWSHHDLPERADALQGAYIQVEAGAEAMQREYADLRARLESLCVEMENDDRAGKLTHWTGAIRAELRKEVK